MGIKLNQGVRGAPSETRKKRESLVVRDRIAAINRSRVEAGKEELKDTPSVKAQVQAEQAAADAQGLKAAQKTVRELNESAQRTGSPNRYKLIERGGQVQVVKEQQVRVAQSTGVGVGGPQQIPGLQTQVTPSARVEERFVPVGSSREGGSVLLDTETGKTVTEVGTSREGGTVFLETAQPTQSKALPFGREQNDRAGAGFATPLFFIGSERREDLQKAGKFLYEGGETIKAETKNAPLPFKVAGAVTAYGSQAVGGGLERLGYDPQGTVFKEVVVPAAGGAAAGSVFAAGSKAAPGVIETVASTSSIKAVQSLAGKGAAITKGAEKGLAVVSVAGAGAVVASREAYEQSPDILFGFLGGAAGAKPTGDVNKINAIVPKEQYVYGGSPGVPNRAARLNLPTSGKPTSKAQIRKQSFNQNYNPNLYKQGAEFGFKTGKEREFVRFLEKGAVEVGKRRPASEFGVKGQSVEAGFKVQKGQAPQEFQRFTYTQPGGKTAPLPGSSKLSKVTDRPLDQLGYRDTLVAVQKSQAFQAVKAFEGGKRVPVKPTERFVDQSQFLAQQKGVPEFELRPNAPSNGFSQYAQETRVPGSQPGRGRVYENIIARALAKNAQRTDFVFVEPPRAPVSTAAAPQVKDIALSGRFSNVPSVVSARGVSDIAGVGGRPGGVDRVVVPEVKVNTISRPIQSQDSGVKVTFALAQKNEIETETKQKTFAVAGTGRVQAQPINIDSAAFVPPQVKQVPIAAQSSVVEQRSKTRSESVVRTGFDFRGPTAPELTFPTTELPYSPPAPRVARPQPPKPQTLRPELTGLPPVPPRFGFPEKARSNTKYEVQVGAKGNKYFFDLGAGGPEILSKARDLVKGTAAATVRVKSFGRGEKDLAGFFGSEFTQTKPGVFVQKTEKRISSRGEKEQIPGASRSARLSKGTAFGDALRKLNEGFSLRGIRRGLK